MPDMKEFNDTRKFDEMKAAYEAGAELSVAELREIVSALLDQQKIAVEAKDAADEQSGTLKDLLNSSDKLAAKEDQSAESLSALSAATEAAAMAQGSDDKGTSRIVDTLKSLGGHLRTMVKQNVKALNQDKGVGKIFKKMAKSLAKGEEQKTKIAGGDKDKKDEGKKDKPNMIFDLASMGKEIAKKFNPVEMVTTFVTQILKYIIIFGIILYAIVTGWFDGDLNTFISTLVLTIVLAVYAYFAYLYIKHAIMQAFKITQEVIKTTNDVASSWTRCWAVIAIAGMVALVFIAVAALVLILLAASFLLILVAIWMVCKAITSAIEGMTKDIMAIMGEQFDKLSGMITEVVSTFTTLVPMMAEMMTTVAEDLKTGLSSAISGISATFTMMTTVMQNLADEISSIFNGLAAAILASSLGKAFTPDKEEIADVTIDTLEAEIWTGFGFGNALISALVDSFESITSTVAGAIAGFLDKMSNAASQQNSLAAVNDEANIVEDTADESLSMITEVGYSAIGMMGAATGAFIGTMAALTVRALSLFSGFGESNSFSEAIAPLIATADEIASLIKTLVADNSLKQQQMAMPENSINMPLMQGSTAVNNAYNTFGATDAAQIVSEQKYTPDLGGTSNSEGVDSATFISYMDSIISALGTIAKNSKPEKASDRQMADLFKRS